MIYRTERVEMVDALGRTNKQISEYADIAVPGVEYEYGFEEERFIEPQRLIFDRGKKLDIKFRSSPDKSMRVEIFRGPHRDRHTLVIRYLDLKLPANVMVWFTFSPAGVSDLRYDGDGDGRFESTVKPQYAVTGNDAADLTDPMIRIDAPVSGSTARNDLGDGYRDGHQICRLSDRSRRTDRLYRSLELDVSRPHEIYIVADDRAGNRSLLVKELKVSTSTNGSDPFKIRSIPF